MAGARRTATRWLDDTEQASWRAFIHSVNDLMAPDRFAARLQRDLRLPPPVAQPMRLFA